MHLSKNEQLWLRPKQFSFTGTVSTIATWCISLYISIRSEDILDVIGRTILAFLRLIFWSQLVNLILFLIKHFTCFVRIKRANLVIIITSKQLPSPSQHKNTNYHCCSQKRIIIAKVASLELRIDNFVTFFPISIQQTELDSSSVDPDITQLASAVRHKQTEPCWLYIWAMAAVAAARFWQLWSKRCSIFLYSLYITCSREIPLTLFTVDILLHKSRTANILRFYLWSFVFSSCWQATTMKDRCLGWMASYRYLLWGIKTKQILLNQNIFSNYWQSKYGKLILVICICATEIFVR